MNLWKSVQISASCGQNQVFCFCETQCRDVEVQDLMTTESMQAAGESFTFIVVLAM